MMSLLVDHLGGVLISAVVAVVGGLIHRALVQAFARQAVQDMVMNYAGTLLHRGLSEVTAPLAMEFMDYAHSTVSGSIKRLGVTQQTLVDMLVGKIGVLNGVTK